jgi:hypothetical protein
MKGMNPPMRIVNRKRGRRMADALSLMKISFVGSSPTIHTIFHLKAETSGNKE